ncbi:MAG: hypothetical protein AAFU83_04485, partial [Bacteroidota bacterium]
YKALTKDTRREIFFILNHERNPCLFLPIRILEYILGTIRKMLKPDAKSQLLPITSPCTMGGPRSTPIPRASVNSSMKKIVN